MKTAELSLDTPAPSIPLDRKSAIQLMDAGLSESAENELVGGYDRCRKNGYVSFHTEVLHANHGSRVRREVIVGPADLRHDLEHHAQWNVDAFDECLATVVKAAQRHQKAAGILCRGIESIKTFAEQGFTEIAVESDLSILRQAYQQIQAAVRIKS